MAESEPAGVLNVSNYLETDSEQQQYVKIDSNMFIGTKDGIKYSLVQTSDGTLRLVEVLSDSNASLNSSIRSFVTAMEKEDTIELHDDWVTPTNKPKLIKLMALKSDPSPCKGQGDEIGNTVISPTCSISSFKESEKSELRKVNLSEISTDQDSSSQLTYTTLLPKQQNKEILINTYNSTPPSSQCNYSTPFPNSVLIRSPRYTKKPRIQLIPATSSFSPIPRARVSAPRQRRPRQTIYHYTPQILHSTPNTLSNVTLSNDCPASLSESSSESQTTPTSFEYPRVPNNTPVSAEVESAAGNQNVISVDWIPHMETGVENCVLLDAREIHNEKERKRRMRIKVACQCIRSLLPFCLSEKIDNASVFEQTVEVISFMKETVGDAHDTEFLEQHHDF